MWHDEGRAGNKLNTFTDFVTCAEYMAASGLTRPDLMAAHAGSAGGTVLGASVVPLCCGGAGVVALTPHKCVAWFLAPVCSAGYVANQAPTLFKALVLEVANILCMATGGCLPALAARWVQDSPLLLLVGACAEPVPGCRQVPEQPAQRVHGRRPAGAGHTRVAPAPLLLALCCAG